MHVTLKTLADIRSGYTFREAIVEQEAGDVRVVQIKDIRQRTAVDVDSLPKITWDSRGLVPALVPGEIVMAARGDHNTSALFTGGATVIATNQLLILTTREKSVLPEFLCWSLNRPATLRQLEDASRGTGIMSINKGMLEKLSLQIPSIEKQHKIIALQQLWDQEAQLLEALKKNRETMLTGMFQKLLEN